jgi:aspartyl protease
MFIKATINRQHDVLLMIDTAASSTVLTRQVADRLRLAPSDNLYVGHTVDDARRFRYQKTTIERLEAGGQTVENFPVLISERELYYANSHYEKNGINGFDGLLGADFLSRFLVSIDVPNDQIEFSALGQQAARHAPTGQSISFRLDRFAVILELEVAKGVKGNFIFDTGAACSIFSTRIAGALDIKQEQTETIPLTRARGIGGMIRQFVALKHESVYLSGIEVPTEYVLVQDLDYSSVFGDLRIDGILGGHILYNFRLTLDYGNSKLVLDRVA